MMNTLLRSHVLKLLSKGKRLDGRGLTEFRSPISVRYNISESAEGSAEVKIGDTIMIAGVKMEIGKPYPDTPKQGSIIIGAELSPLSSPEFELGPPSIKAVELARVIDRGIRESKSIDFEKLCITPGEKTWTALIDLVPINDAGNLFDSGSLAAIAAIKNAKFPEFDGEKLDYKHKSSTSLPLEKTPISITVYKIGEHLIVDPTNEEEGISDARLTVAVEEDGTICALQKGGTVMFDENDIAKIIDIAKEKSIELRSYL